MERTDHNPIARFLYHARHYLLNSSEKFVFALDLAVSLAATFLAFLYCRFLYRGNWLMPNIQYILLIDLAVTGIVLWNSGLYRSMIRFTTLKDIQRLLGAILLSCILISLVYTFLWPAYYKVHFAGVVFNFMLTSVALIGGRLACIGGRSWLDHFRAEESLSSITTSGRKRVALAGKLDACLLKASLIRSLKSEEYEIVGILTSEQQADGRTIRDIPVRFVREASDVEDVLGIFKASAIIFVGKDDLLEEKSWLTFAWNGESASSFPMTCSSRFMIIPAWPWTTCRLKI